PRARPRPCRAGSCRGRARPATRGRGRSPGQDSPGRPLPPWRILRGMDLLHTAHVPAGEGPFPTILALHGWGASAHHLLGLAPVLLGGEALVLCPQGPVAFQVGPGMAGYGWFPIVSGRPPDAAEFAKGADALRAFLDAALHAYPVDPRKLVVLGFSQGGVMA